MDTKWKGSKRLFLYAAAAGMAAAFLFMSLFTFFRERAEASYSDPLISREFADRLFSVNYVQYKYLRERADQTHYSYPQLYLSRYSEDGASASDEALAAEILSELYPSLSSDPSAAAGMAADEESDDGLLRNVQRILSSQEDYLESVLSEYEQTLASFGGILDYYVEDLESGVYLSNCGKRLPDAIFSEGQSDPADSSRYVYYVSMEYDSAGNVGNISVRSRDDARQFMNTVQTAGHEKQLSLAETGDSGQELSQDGQQSSYRVYDDYHDAYAELQLSLSSPKNMRAIYGLTQEQYDSLLQGNGSLRSESFGNDLYLAMENSYEAAGVIPVYLFLLLAAAVSGLLLVSQAAGRVKGEGSGTRLIAKAVWPGKGLYLEAAVILAVLLCSFARMVLRFTAEYENGIFLKSILTGLGDKGRILFLPADRIVLFLFLSVLFAAAFLTGAGLSGIRRDTLRERSLISRYWHKIYSRVRTLCRSFYSDLIRYDIGTDANRIILKILGVNFFILMMICCFWFAGILGLIVYTVIVYFILKRYVMDIQEKYRKLLHATSSIAQGNLDTALSEDFGVFESYKSQLRRIQSDFKRAVEEEVRSQRMKSELITNVSHDLKTPLTAIITYVDLLRSPGLPQEKQEEYLEVLQRKSNRLKVLIEDLFEISKASSRAVTLQIVDVDICSLLRQAYLEQEDRISAADLDFRFDLPEGKILLSLDSQKTYRIFDNLYNNIIKYALKGTRVYVSLTEEKREEKEFVRIELKNISAAELSVDPNELTERFVRGDGSRNTEGSGLGLAIAKSFAELQGGSMRIETDGDLFKAVLLFPRETKSPLPNSQHPDAHTPHSQANAHMPQTNAHMPQMDAHMPQADASSARPAGIQPGQDGSTVRTNSPGLRTLPPPAPWNRRSNRIYRKQGETPGNSPSSRHTKEAWKAGPGPQKKSGFRAWLRTLWFGDRP